MRYFSHYTWIRENLNEMPDDYVLMHFKPYFWIINQKGYLFEETLNIEFYSIVLKIVLKKEGKK